MRAIKLINKILSKYGAQLIRYPSKDMSNRMKLIKHHKINKILDIGANRGSYGVELRNYGYQEQILSFEPLNKVFSMLKNNCKNDNKWNAYNYAIGDSNTEMEINIAGNIDSSSLLDILPQHVESAPKSAYIGKEKIKVYKLDSIFKEFYNEGDNIYLKIDTQGFEKNVLDGAKESLKYIRGIQIEMSIVPLYNTQVLYQELINILNKNNFKLYSLENGFYDKNTGQLLQFDGVFYKES